MAYLDVKAYFLQVEDQYLSMYNELKNFEQSYQNGELSKEQLETIKDNLLTLKANYERLAYVMYLFNKPKSTKKHNNIKDDLEDKFEFIGATKKQVIDENTFILNDIRQYLKEATKEK